MKGDAVQKVLIANRGEIAVRVARAPQGGPATPGEEQDACGRRSPFRAVRTGGGSPARRVARGLRGAHQEHETDTAAALTHWLDAPGQWATAFDGLPHSAARSTHRGNVPAGLTANDPTPTHDRPA